VAQVGCLQELEDPLNSPDQVVAASLRERSRRSGSHWWALDQTGATATVGSALTDLTDCAGATRSTRGTIAAVAIAGTAGRCAGHATVAAVVARIDCCSPLHRLHHRR